MVPRRRRSSRGPGTASRRFSRQWAGRLAGLAAWHSCLDADNDPATLLTALGSAAGLGPGIATVAALVAAPARAPHARSCSTTSRRSPVPGASTSSATSSTGCPTRGVSHSPREPEPRLPLARLRAAGDLLEIREERALVAGRRRGPGPRRASECRSPRTRRPRCTTGPRGGPPACRSPRWRSARPKKTRPPRSPATTGSSASTCAPRSCPVWERARRTSWSAARSSTSSRARCATQSCGTRFLRRHARAPRSTPGHPTGGAGRRPVPEPSRSLHDLMRAELHRKEPTLVPELHRRAAGWYADNGMLGRGDRARPPQRRRRGAGSAGARRRPGDLGERPHRGRAPVDVVARGRQGRLDASRRSRRTRRSSSRWWESPRAPTGGRRWPAETRGTGIALGRQHDRGDARLPACDRGTPRRQSRCGSTRGEAWAGMSPSSPFRVTMLHTEGLAALLAGDLDARRRPVRPSPRGRRGRRDPIPLVAMVLCERAAIAVERGDWRSAVPAVRRATAIVADGGLRVVLDERARARLGRTRRRTPGPAHRGDQAHSRAPSPCAPSSRTRCLSSRRRHLLTIAQASLALGDLHAASATVQQANEIMRRRPGLGDLPDRVDAMATLVHEADLHGAPRQAHPGRGPAHAATSPRSSRSR